METNYNTIKRENVTIPKGILRSILRSYGSKENYKWVLIEDIITSSDTEDGGADHDVVMQRISDGKYFAFCYTDWDMDYNFERDFPEEVSEVFPIQVTKTEYK